MDTDMIIEMLKNNRALWVTATVTGIFAIIISILDAIWLFIQKRKQLEYDKQLEKYKHIAEKKNYVSKVRFDAEFTIYRELSQAFSEAIEGVHGIIPNGEAYYPNDEDERTEYEEQLFSIFAKASYKAQKSLFSNAPFISKDIYDKFSEIMDLIRTQSEVYNEAHFDTTLSNAEGEITEEDTDRTALIDVKFDNLINEIRDYLSKLEILEEK